MELTAIYKRVIGLDVHQAKISACALMQQPERLRVFRSGQRQVRGFHTLHSMSFTLMKDLQNWKPKQPQAISVLIF